MENVEPREFIMSLGDEIKLHSPNTCRLKKLFSASCKNLANFLFNAAFGILSG
jgi:hypothetical protein